MKKSKELVEINNGLVATINNIEENLDNVREQVSEYYKKIKKEFAKILIEQKYELLLKISEDEQLDIEILKKKYLKPKELANLSLPELINNNIDSEELLDRIEYKDQVYYYENKEKGKVYDSEYIEVGIFKHNTINLN
jgi:alpha-mannosidase